MSFMIPARWSMALFLAATVTFGADLRTVTVLPRNGRAVTGVLDPRTNEQRLWLRFGSDAASIQRGFDWSTVGRVRDAERELSRSDVLALTASEPKPPRDISIPRIIAVPTSSSPPISSVARQVPPRVAFVTSDARLANWDLDLETDGLLVQVTPRDAHGVSVSVQGVLHVELHSFRRIDQDSAAHGRGQSVGLLGRWTERFNSQPDGEPAWLRLPFSPSIPEFDPAWAPYGLLRIELVVPGAGVFQDSIDGLRTRPFAPFRDTLERQTGSRLLPGEAAR